MVFTFPNQKEADQYLSQTEQLPLFTHMSSSGQVLIAVLSGEQWGRLSRT
jgi:hypothetical protein